jgi:hypothetical protein
VRHNKGRSGIISQSTIAKMHVRPTQDVSLTYNTAATSHPLLPTGNPKPIPFYYTGEQIFITFSIRRLLISLLPKILRPVDDHKIFRLLYIALRIGLISSLELVNLPNPVHLTGTKSATSHKAIIFRKIVWQVADANQIATIGQANAILIDYSNRGPECRHIKHIYSD